MPLIVTSQVWNVFLTGLFCLFSTGDISCLSTMLSSPVVNSLKLRSLNLIGWHALILGTPVDTAVGIMSDFHSTPDATLIFYTAYLKFCGSPQALVNLVHHRSCIWLLPAVGQRGQPHGPKNSKSLRVSWVSDGGPKCAWVSTMCRVKAGCLGTAAGLPDPRLLVHSSLLSLCAVNTCSAFCSLASSAPSSCTCHSAWSSSSSDIDIGSRKSSKH